MTAIPFASWRPDVAVLNTTYTADVRNVLRAAGFYIPFPTLTPFSEALPGAPVGGITVRDADGGIHIFAGTATGLFKLDSATRDWTPVSKLGSDQATNGAFGSDTGWTKGTNVTISGGAAHFTAVADGQTLRQSQSLVAGTIYKIVFTISSRSAGGVFPFFSGGVVQTGDVYSADGTYTTYLTSGSGNAFFGFEADGTTTLDIDNVTLTPMAVYAASVDNRWRFRDFGGYVVAVNINDDAQVFQIGTSTEFANLAGSPPRAHDLAVCGDHLFLVTDDGVSWSDTDDITNWSTGNSGSQTFPDGGPVQGLTDTTNPIVFQRNAIRAGTFVPGSSLVFTFQKIHDRRGAAASYSIASRGEFAFFADSGGFYQITSSGQLLPIGKEKVDRTLFGSLASDGLATIYAEVDPFFTRVYFAIKINSTSDSFDRLIIYDWDLQEWTQIEGDFDILIPLSSGTVGYTLEGLDSLYASLDAMDASLDSRVFQGGSPVMAAFDTNYQLGFFAGPNAEAIVTTGEVGSTGGEVNLIRSVFAHGIDAPPSTAGSIGVAPTTSMVLSIGTRMLRHEVVTWTPELIQSVTGAFDKLSAARFHQFKVRIAAGVTWTAAQGLDVPGQFAGIR